MSIHIKLLLYLDAVLDGTCGLAMMRCAGLRSAATSSHSLSSFLLKTTILRRILFTKCKSYWQSWAGCCTSNRTCLLHLLLAVEHLAQLCHQLFHFEELPSQIQLPGLQLSLCSKAMMLHREVMPGASCCMWLRQVYMTSLWSIIASLGINSSHQVRSGLTLSVVSVVNFSEPGLASYCVVQS